MVLFDTSVIIDMIRGGEYRYGSVSIISLIEILRVVKGEKRSRVKALFEETFNIYPIDNRVVEIYCHLYDRLKMAGQLIPDIDLIIAATAIAHNEKLESHDEHFIRLKGFGLKFQRPK